MFLELQTNKKKTPKNIQMVGVNRRKHNINRHISKE